MTRFARPYAPAFLATAPPNYGVEGFLAAGDVIVRAMSEDPRLKHFLAEAGFPLDQIQTGSWGNRACVIANLASFLTSYDPDEHPLQNEPDVPYHVWALARRGLS